jgi:hypothetical protein
MALSLPLLHVKRTFSRDKACSLRCFLFFQKSSFLTILKMTKLYQNFINADIEELMRRIAIRQAKSLYSFLDKFSVCPGKIHLIEPSHLMIIIKNMGCGACLKTTTVSNLQI